MDFSYSGAIVSGLTGPVGTDGVHFSDGNGNTCVASPAATSTSGTITITETATVLIPASGTSGTILPSGTITLNSQEVAYTWNGGIFSLTNFVGVPSGSWATSGASSSAFAPASGYTVRRSPPAARLR